MHIHPSLTTLALLASAELPIRTIYQFASNDTWLENLAVRSNGIILATEIGPPANLLAFNPRSPFPPKNHPTYLRLRPRPLRHHEAAHDIFYITGANTTSANIGDPLTNTTHVWRVDFTGNANSTNPNVTLIARPTAPTGFNGLAAFNETIILAVDTTTGYTWEAIKDEDLMSSLNGLKVQDGFVYWTAGGDFCRARLYDNVTAGPGEVIAQGTSFDDYAVAPDGFRAASGRKYAYAATAAQNPVMEISFDLEGGRNRTEVVAGDLDSTEIAEPTGCAFGREKGEANVSVIAYVKLSSQYLTLETNHHDQDLATQNGEFDFM